MGGICGWFGTPSAGVEPQAIGAMAGALSRFDSSAPRTALDNFGAVAAAALGSNADVHHAEGQLVAIWGSARFSEPELASSARQRGLACTLGELYSRTGLGALAGLSGSFALAILTDREALLATDRIGTHPVLYHVANERLVFGSTTDSIRAFPHIQLNVSHQAIYNYIYFHMIPAPDTIYSGVRRLLPGEYLRFSGGKAEIGPYWQMRYVENERRALPELKEEFLSTLRASVQHTVGPDQTGAFLSGGTDSSTVAGMLGEITGQPARTYSIGFEAEGYDEMHYARIAAKHFGTRHHEYYVTPDDVVNAIPLIAAVHDQPFGNSSAVPTYYCAKLARQDGVEALLGGDGGDELFGGNERYATQYIYSIYGDLPVALRKALEPMIFLAPEVGIIGKAQRYIRHASLPMPERYNHYNLLERLGPEAVFTDEFLGSVDRNRPSEDLARSYSSALAESLVNRMLALDLSYTLADNDLPKVARSCELAGVDVRFPLLSDSLVAFSARLAPDLKLRRTKLRYFFKEALRGFLPDEIITKTKHGFGMPFGRWLQGHKPLMQLAWDTLSDLKQRGIIRPTLIDQLTTVHLKTHADYYGTMVWILVMLEQWLKSRRSWHQTMGSTGDA